MNELDREKRSIWSTEVHKLILPPRLASWWETFWTVSISLFFIVLGLLMAGWGGGLLGVDVYHWLRFGTAEWHTFGALSPEAISDWVGLHKLIDRIHVGLVSVPFGLVFYWIGRARWPWRDYRPR